MKPTCIDLLSPKIHMLLAGFAALLVCFVSWDPALQVGFLLDDFLHLDYLSRAVHGDSGDFLHNFYGNWANSPIMQSFRPLVSLNLFCDYVVFGSNPVGFHLINLLLYWGSAFMVGLISLELSGLRGNRLGASAAIWAVLLFSVYPLHLEAASWIIGRVDLLCTLFCLISVFCYLRYKILHEHKLLLLSLIAFAAALLSKEMAVTLPLVITAAELLLGPLWQEKTAAEFDSMLRTRRLCGVLSFWFVLGAIASLRFLALQNLIGGYGSNSPDSSLKGHFGLKTFLSRFLKQSAIDRILFPVNLDLLNRLGQQAAWDLNKTLQTILKSSYIGVLSIALVRVLLKSINLRIVAFLIFWTLISLLPTFQVWEISPNLVGSRLFFLSSAPFVILLSFLALPAIDVLKSNLARTISISGSAMLLVIVCIWSYWLQFDFKSWTGAARSLESFRLQVETKLRSLPEDKSILLLNLPSDYSGAGMITLEHYLHLMLGQPLAGRILVLEPELKANLNYSKKLSAMLQDKSLAEVFSWKEPQGMSETGSLNSWQDAGGSETLKLLPTADTCLFVRVTEDQEHRFERIAENKLESIPLTSSKEWVTVVDGGRTFQQNKDSLLIMPGDKGLTLVFPRSQVCPRKALTAEIQAKCISGKAPELTLLWLPEAGANESTSNHDLDTKKELEFCKTGFELKGDKQVIKLGELRQWASAPTVTRFAIHIPKGSYELELSSLELKNEP